MDEGWKETFVELRLPAEKVKSCSEKEAPCFQVPGLYHRNIISIIHSIYSSDTFFERNVTPYKEYIHTSSDPSVPPERIWGETFTADAHYQFHEDVQKLRQTQDMKWSMLLLVCSCGQTEHILPIFGTHHSGRSTFTSQIYRNTYAPSQALLQVII